MAGIATIVFAIGILGFFWLDRDKDSETSSALWIPVAWLLIAGSRMVSQWLQFPTPSNTAEMYVDGSPLDRDILTGLLVIGLIVLIRRASRVFTTLRANVPIVLFFLYCAASILWSDFPGVASKRWVKALGDLVMILIVLTDVDPRAAVKRLLARSGFVLIPLSVLLIKYYPDYGRAYHPWSWTPYYIGVTTDKNLLGMICMVFGVGFAWRFLEAFHRGEGSRRVRPLIAHGAALGITFWLFWIVGSVTSLCCFLLAGVLMMMTSLPVVVRKPSIIHMFVVTTLCVAFFALVLNVGPGLLQTMGRDPTLTGRTEIWNEVLGLTGNPLLGTGFESFWMGERLQMMWSLHWWHPNEAHNGYLEIFLNLGWMGVILLLLLMITGYRNAINVLRWDADGGKLRLAYILVAAVYSFTEAGFRMMNPVWIVFLLMTTKVPENHVHEETEFRTLSDTSDTEGYGDDQPYTADVCEEVV